MYYAKNVKTKKIKVFKSRQRCNNFIDRKNAEYGSYLWVYMFLCRNT